MYVPTMTEHWTYSLSVFEIMKDYYIIKRRDAVQMQFTTAISVEDRHELNNDQVDRVVFMTTLNSPYRIRHYTELVLT